MQTNLHIALREKLSLSDAEFGQLCDLSRLSVWKLRTGRGSAHLETAVRVRDALAKLGVTLSLEELLARPTSKRKRKAA